MKPALVLLVALGCASPPDASSDTLLRGVQTYSDDMRWRRWEDAATFVPPARREAYLDVREEHDDDLRFVGVQVKRVRLRGDRKSALVQLEVQWMRDSEGILHETTIEQLWQKAGGLWLLDAEYFHDGDALPIVEGPDEPPDQKEEPA